MIGKVFGRWTVIEDSGERTYGTVLYLCECVCGTRRPVRSTMLRNGTSQSCGCLHREIISGIKNTLEERLWKYINKRGPNDCWLWTASLNAYGYGQIQSEGKNRKPLRASRVVYSLTKGPIPKGKHVLHTCDNRACCNPKHLRVGTHQDNMDDMNTKGRNGNVGRKLSTVEITRRQKTRYGEQE